MNVVTKKLDELRPVARNVRRHPQAQINELIRSYKMFGQYRPLVVTADGEVLVGNGLYVALKEMGVENAEVIVLPADVPEAYKNKLMLADNHIYSMGADDVGNIDSIIAEMKDFDIPGFDSATLEQLYSTMKSDEETIKNMGTIPPEKVEAINKVATDRAENPRTERVTGKTESDYGDVNKPVPTPDSEAPKGNYVNCPHCGAKIWL